jgi:penicillin-binding protein 1A
VLTSLLQGVVQRGTGAAANSLNWTLAGKTGTVDDYTDAWFIGFDPDITVGVWIGFDDKRRSLGSAEQGSLTALPVWMEFMKAYLAARPAPAEPLDFQAPGNIVFQAVERVTGTPVEGEPPAMINESFIAGTQPGDLAPPPQ